MVLPGTASHSPWYQSLMTGWEISPAESCAMGDATMSFRGCGKYFAAASLVALARSRKMFQSVFDSHTGGMAAESGWMKECRSVLFRSAFSYQEAAGNTMSEYNAEESIRKLRSTTRSIFPTGATSCHFTSLVWSSESSAMAFEWVHREDGPGC